MTVWLKVDSRAGERGERQLVGKIGNATEVYVVEAEMGALVVICPPNRTGSHHRQELASHYRTMEAAKDAAFRRIAGAGGSMAWGAFP